MSQPSQTPNLPRFFQPRLCEASVGGATGDLCVLDKAESHHARQVLRLSAGNSVELFDGQGASASARIEQFDAGRAVCRIESVQRQPAFRPQITIASAVPKGPRADAMVDQLSQLGADRFVPLRAEYSVAVPKPGKIEKFARSAIESAKQCGRNWLMQIEEVRVPEEAWSDTGFDLKLITAPGCDPLPDLSERLQASLSVLVLIGPEGGWSTEELASARDAGCLFWTIAQHILRIETASAAAAAILRYSSMT